MTVEDVRTVTIPSQAQPADPPLAPAAASSAPAPAPVAPSQPGSVRPLTAEERQFRNGLLLMFVALECYIVTFLLLAEYVWG